MPVNTGDTGPILHLDGRDWTDAVQVADDYPPNATIDQGVHLYLGLIERYARTIETCTALTREQVEELHAFLGHWLDRTGPFAS